MGWDIALLVGPTGTENGLQAHKHILVEKSLFFQEMFQAEPNLSIIKIRDSNLSETKVVLKYCYLGKLALQGQSMEGALRLACRLRIPHIVNIILTHQSYALEDSLPQLTENQMNNLSFPLLAIATRLLSEEDRLDS